MITTAERADLLATHCLSLMSERFLGTFSAQDLIQWVKLELGNNKILDQYIPYGNESNYTKAIPHEPILHVLSGNTPHAGLQSLLRGILVGAHNIIKLPSSGLPEITEWIKKLPKPLAKMVSITEELDESLFHSTKTVIAIGSDSTMNEIQSRISPHQRFIPHGHKLSIGLIKHPSQEAAKLAVQDACSFNQQGCLSLHTIYVMNDAKSFLPLVAEAMSLYEQDNPRGDINISASGAISNLRETIRYEAANNPNQADILHSEENTNWTVIYKNSPVLSPSVLNRVISIQPWPKKFQDLGPEKEYISTLAVDGSISTDTLPVNISRICPLGKSQNPSLSWHHDGFEPLRSLIRWQDIEK